MRVYRSLSIFCIAVVISINGVLASQCDHEGGGTRNSVKNATATRFEGGNPPCESITLARYKIHTGVVGYTLFFGKPTNINSSTSIYKHVQEFIQHDHNNRVNLIVELINDSTDLTLQKKIFLCRGLSKLLTSAVQRWIKLMAFEFQDEEPQVTVLQNTPEITLHVAKFIPVNDVEFFKTCKLFHSLAPCWEPNGLKLDQLLNEIKTCIQYGYAPDAQRSKKNGLAKKKIHLPCGDPLYDAMHYKPPPLCIIPIIYCSPFSSYNYQLTSRFENAVRIFENAVRIKAVANLEKLGFKLLPEVRATSFIIENLALLGLYNPEPENTHQTQRFLEQKGTKKNSNIIL